MISWGFLMVYANDTIASISTAMSDAGIGIIRVSGQDAIPICDSLLVSGKMARDLKERPAGSIRFGYAVDKDLNKLDEVLVSVMKAPHSYTGEDTVEINCHGGRMVLERVLQEVLYQGARLAQPGEFSKRAFLNGKMDLTQAEAVMDLITAQNAFSLANSEKQLNGFFRDQIRHLRDQILLQTAHIEAALDDPENEDLSYNNMEMSAELNHMLSRINSMIESYSEGLIRKEGIKTVILGKPNTGKSTLLNLLAKEEKAIVTDLPGTTRDVVEESVKVGDLTLRLMDTAGIRETDNVVEKIGVTKALKESEDAELILLLFDLTQKPDDESVRLVHLVKTHHVIILLNKSDLSSDLDCYQSFIAQAYTCKDAQLSSLPENQRERALSLPPIIPCSFLQGKGVQQLERTIASLFLHNELIPKQEFYLTSVRHRDALKRTKESLILVKEGLLSKVSEEFLTVDLMNAYSSLGEIIGEEVGDDLVDEIFSKFCMGK